MWHDKLICSKILYPCSSKAIASKIQKNDLSIKSLMLTINQKYDQKTHIPHTLVQECRTNLNIISCLTHMLAHKSCDLTASNHFHRKSHGKKTISIFSKSLSVSKVSPSAYSLAKNKAIHYGICHHQKALFLDPAIDKSS